MLVVAALAAKPDARRVLAARDRPALVQAGNTSVQAKPRALAQLRAAASGSFCAERARGDGRRACQLPHHARRHRWRAAQAASSSSGLAARQPAVQRPSPGRDANGLCSPTRSAICISCCRLSRAASRKLSDRARRARRSRRRRRLDHAQLDRRSRDCRDAARDAKRAEATAESNGAGKPIPSSAQELRLAG